ncbi:hypothetical protein [Microbacterium karelineae]|uniref:hypothetical protein n=1 Tax=Microbacterium karelineae TaxID=2654283 RepID=UPI0012EA449F|nr:hypothetical protein [Microbacterium karelineae]
MTSAAPPRPRRRRTGWIILASVAAVFAVVLVIALVVMPPVLARQEAEARYADAVAAQNATAEEHREAHAAFRAAADPALESLALADEIVTDRVRPYVGAGAFEAASEAAGAVRDVDDLPDAQDPPEARPAEHLDSTDAYTAAAEELEDEAAALAADAERLTASAGAYSERGPALDDAIADLRATIPDETARLEEANISSRAIERVRLQYAADLAATSDDTVAYYVDEYVAAAQVVERSQATELAEKEVGDGLYETRLEIEDFVRSIVGDTRVDFDWAPIVNGLGAGESAGGFTTWWYSDGGYATMELSHSIAAYWPDARFESLVVHEAGHAITSQCRDMLADPFDGDVELMATAWAIGMGYDNPWGNGVDYYYGGVPPADDLVDASKACR